MLWLSPYTVTSCWVWFVLLCCAVNWSQAGGCSSFQYAQPQSSPAHSALLLDCSQPGRLFPNSAACQNFDRNRGGAQLQLLVSSPARLEERNIQHPQLSSTLAGLVTVHGYVGSGSKAKLRGKEAQQRTLENPDSRTFNVRARLQPRLSIGSRLISSVANI